ncbi:MAG: aspartate--tRNA ligase [Candidatus Omnitrophica bacterium]|nr:aspartate--tRNA ligase [Candidatus Omnitrophota bacterium]
MRTHNCGELSKDNIGKEVVLCGWVNCRRDHGGLIFIDLRDKQGITQIVFNSKQDLSLHQLANNLRSEDVLLLKGCVKERPKGTLNSNISTGEIEVKVSYLEILNKSEPLPFEIGDEQIDEEIRLAYRYLDLRNSQMQNTLAFRHKACLEIRNFLSQQGFTEIETPMLTKSTPEGARDFLVPSRLSKGKFYALPQSPQLFKQILMVGGVEKYFQIVRCFRDEDFRADRQLEHTQIDLELSFVDRAKIMKLTERMLADLFDKLLNVQIDLPFPVFSYAEAMEKFNSDKPKIEGEKFNFLWVVDFPLAEYNQERKRWVAKHHPFTSPYDEDLELLESKPSAVRTKSYDLILNGIEIGGGSIRIHKPDIQKRLFKLLEIEEKRFDFLLKALSYGAPPHGGIALGLDRLLMLMLNKKTIREVIAFPKTQKGVCLLSGAPDEVSEEQMKEIGIEIKSEI